MALWTGLFYQLYSDREPPIHHSVCDELEARMLYLPTKEELRKEFGPVTWTTRSGTTCPLGKNQTAGPANFNPDCKTQCVLALDLTYCHP